MLHDATGQIESAGTPLAVQGIAVAERDASWASLRDAKVADAGSPFWVGTLDATAVGIESVDALVRGTASSIDTILEAGQVLPNGQQLARNQPILRYSVAPSGSSTLALVRTESDTSNSEAVVFVDSTRQELSLIAERDGLVGRGAPGWVWHTLKSVSLTERSLTCTVPSWYAAGIANGGTGDRWVVVRDGEIVVSEGDKVCNPFFELRGPVFALDTNSSGDVASIWMRATDNGVTRAAPVVLINKLPIFACGMSVPGTAQQSYAKVSHIFPTIAISDRRSSGLTSIYINVLVASDEYELSEGKGVSQVLEIVTNLGPDAFCLADFNGDEIVDQTDLTLFVLAWIERTIDVDCDSDTDEDDLLTFIGQWYLGC